MGKILEPTSSTNEYGGLMHYSFNYAKSVHYSQQPGPAYLKLARKCGMFAVTCEPISCQVSY